MADNDHGIAGTAYDLVYGARAKTYGHPKIDFTIIANIWTGLLHDKLKDGATLDPYRVAVLMTGLKLARLVQSPEHTDSRIDTIGYMLTMERLDEVEDVEESVTLKPAEPYEPPMPLSMFTTGKRPPFMRTTADAVREIDKLLGRETAEHSMELDAQQDMSTYGPLLTSPHHPLNLLLRGFKLVSDIEWQEGDRIEELNGENAWLYSAFSDLWYPVGTFDPKDGRNYQFDHGRSLEAIRNTYPMLRVTSGVYKGLLLLENGVGYVPER